MGGDIAGAEPVINHSLSLLNEFEQRAEGLGTAYFAGTAGVFWGWGNAIARFSPDSAQAA